METKDYLKQKALEASIPQKSPGLSAALGFFFPLIGALYAGRYAMAGLFLAIEIVFAILWMIGIGIILTILFHFAAAFVCYNGARKQNAGAYAKAAEALG